MHHKRLLFFLSSSGVVMLSLGLLLVLALPVNAQCGSQASSCKNCHEVQAEDPVNNDGTGWHESHAFGDFCYMCHAGNPQATDVDGAHTGMVPPLEDVEASCVQCHPDDLADRAQVYATTLNISFGMGGSSGSGGDSGGSSDEAPADFWGSEPTAAVEPTPVAAQVVIGIPASNELVVNDPNLVDYVQRYNEIVLGERPVNMGNIVLIGLIALLVVGGGGFVIINELRRATLTKQVDGVYPADVVDMLPALAGLKAETRKSLQKLVQNPKQTAAVVGLISTLGSEDKPEDSAS